VKEGQQETADFLGTVEPALREKLFIALHEIAQAQFSYERLNHTLQPTAIVNELWLKVLKSETEPPKEMRAFRVWAATAIRNILISHARSKGALKRGGNISHVRLNTNHGIEHDPGVGLIELEEELALLEQHSSRAAQVVTLRFYGGLSHCEVAQELGISEYLSQRTWAMARSWLSIRLRGV